MNIGVDTDGILTDMEKWFYTDGLNYTCKLRIIPSKIAFLFYMIFAKPRVGCVEVIKKLRECNRVINITARGYTYGNKFYNIIFRNVLLFWYFRNGIKFDKICICSSKDRYKSKLNACRVNIVDLMIEDTVSLQQYLLNNGIDVIGIKTGYNNSDCKDWYDILKKVEEKKNEDLV